MKLLVSIVIVILLSVGGYILSQQASPSSPLYNVKRASEQVLLATKQSPNEKADYYSVLLNNRLAEMKQIYAEENFDLIIAVSLRYSTTAGKLTEEIKNKNLTDKTAQTKQQFNAHRPELQDMIDKYSKKDDRWKFILDAKNYLDIYEAQLP